MSKPDPEKLTSRALRTGAVLRLLDFAVRGIPTHYMPGEQRIDRSWAIEVYWPELQQLDGLGITPGWFSSGIAGAALVSLALWPDSLELWQRFANQHIRHDELGPDAACLIAEMVFRHQEAENLTRLPEFQFFLFQQSLAVAQACTHQNDYSRQMKRIPPVPDIIKMLDRIRRMKGQRHMMAGFRPTRTLREWWVTPKQPEIIHTATVEQARKLAEAAAKTRSWFLQPADLDSSATKLQEHASPTEFRHPAALAAAMITLAENPSCWPLWERALSGQSVRQPVAGAGSLKDTATRMQDSIILANRSKTPVHASVRLFNRLLNAVQWWHTHGDLMLQNLPRAKKRDPELENAWKPLKMPMTPEYRFESQIKHSSADTPSSRGMDWWARNEELAAMRPGRRKRPRKSARKRLQTGRAAEKWFMANYQDLAPEFSGLELHDCREVLEGYDFALGSGVNRLFVEVKGVLDSSGPITLGDRQWREAHRKGRKYYLVVVFNIAEDSPTSVVIHDPASTLDPECRESIVKVTHWVVESDQLNQRRLA